MYGQTLLTFSGGVINPRFAFHDPDHPRFVREAGSDGRMDSCFKISSALAFSSVVAISRFLHVPYHMPIYSNKDRYQA